MPSENAYSQPVTLKNVLKFAVPTIVMTVFMSFYTMIDGLFVSNLLGTDALSAINLSAPIISLVTAVSTMLATGGSAVIMKKAGEGKIEEARRDFTFLILVNIGVGILMSLLGYALMDKIFAGMGLSQKVFDYCHAYLSRYLLFTVPILLMNNFTLYMIASGRSTLSMLCSITGGVLNILLDYLLIEMPPGTGDVPLTVFQSIPVDGIVVVTSPQDLVSLIVTKAVRMAEMMHKPILGVVENYSYFQCPNCGEKHYIFGKSNLEQVAKDLDVKVLAQIPMDPAMATAMDQGAVESLEKNYLEPVADAILAHEKG